MSWLPPFFVRVGLPQRYLAFWVPVFLLWPLWLLTLGLCLGGLSVLGISVGRQPLAAATSIALACTRSLHELVCATRGAEFELSTSGRGLSFSIA
jgi:hypothetical protein